MDTNPFVASVRFDRASRGAANLLMLARDFALDAYRFDQHLLGDMGTRARDLLRIAMGVYVVDRTVRRSQRSTWSAIPRVITMDVQVREPDFWSQPPLTTLIQDTLEFLSSDFWELRFSRLRCDPVPSPGSFAIEPPVPLLCLYSGGLDSAAGLATWLRDHSAGMLAISVLHRPNLKPVCGKQIARLREHYGRTLDLIPLRASLKGARRLDSQERTQRCRAFLFVSAGVVAAIAKGASRVLMFESGTGAMNLPMMAGMATGARTTRGSHPAFLRRMSELGSLVAGRRVDIELPFWNKTKAEIVRTLQEDRLGDVARDSVSCVHHPRRTKYRQCGVCPACIGRRQAMEAAGVSESSMDYEYDIFASDNPRVPPKSKLDALKATLAQVGDLAHVSPNGDLPETLRSWFLGTGIVQKDPDAGPWLAVLRRYRSEWLNLAQRHRDDAIPWASWLLPPENEHERHASGF